MELWGRVVKVKGNKVLFYAENPEELAMMATQTNEQFPQAVLKIPDSRLISDVQRKKIYALFRDIGKAVGMNIEETKAGMKDAYSADYGVPYFSLSNTDMSTAREFISFLMDYVLANEIQLSKPGLSFQDDLDKYMYLCLKHRKCVVCGRPADVHHVDEIGNNAKRELVDHRKKRLIALCRVHHQQAHKMGWLDFAETYHVKGIYLKPDTLMKLHIMTKKRMQEIDRKEAQRGRYEARGL